MGGFFPRTHQAVKITMNTSQQITARLQMFVFSLSRHLIMPSEQTLTPVVKRQMPIKSQGEPSRFVVV